MASSYALPQDSKGQSGDIDSTFLENIPGADHAQHGHSVKYNATTHAHSHHSSHEHSHLTHHHHHPSKSQTFIDKLPTFGKSRARVRGESDLGRSDFKFGARIPSLTAVPTANASSRLGTELSTGLLVSLAFFLPSFVTLAQYGDPEQYGSTHGAREVPSDLKSLQDSVLEAAASHSSPAWSLTCGVGEAFVLTALSLLLHGLVALYWPRQSKSVLSGSGYASPRVPVNRTSERSSTQNLSTRTGQQSVLRAGTIFLAFLASIKLGGWRASTIILSVLASGLVNHSAGLSESNYDTIAAIVAPLALSMVLDLLQITAHHGVAHVICGYGALLPALALLPRQLITPATTGTAATRLRVITPMSPSVDPWSKLSQAKSTTNTPLLNLSSQNAFTSLVGALLSGIVALSVFASFRLLPPLTGDSAGATVILVIATATALTVADSTLLQSASKAGYSLGMGIVLLLGLFTSPVDLYQIIGNSCLTVLCAAALILTTKPSPTSTSHLAHPSEHNHDHHSPVTAWLLDNTDPGSLLHSILHEKDSRRIAYFTCLNFAFMLVQGLYGHLSGSLGLLSDTVHMFFDCLGLIVGLGAAIASKWPPSRDRPYGWAKLNTLAGFGNGIFLMLVSFEFIWEAIEGILEGRELRRVKELFIVSSLGLLVNLVGLFAFGHAHAGHDHSHSHTHGHDHDAHNENMHGIFLHVAADAGGSLAVIISTALTLWQPWYLWDPVATIIIAILIFAAAVPLVVSSGQKLLLIVPENTEYIIKNFLQEVGELRGVLGYAEPRFWTIDAEDEAYHDHNHEQHNHHDSCHEHKHEHGLEHNDGKHSHGHEQSHSVSQPTITLTGSLQVTVVQFALLEEVRLRVQEIALAKGIDLVVHIEYSAPSLNGSAVIS